MQSEVFERIEQLMKSSGRKKQDLNRFLGVSRSTYDNWRRGRSKSFEKYTDKIAIFLNVTPGYILYGKDIPQTSFEKAQEDELLRLFRKVNQKVKDSVLTILDAVANE